MHHSRLFPTTQCETPTSHSREADLDRHHGGHRLTHQTVERRAFLTIVAAGLLTPFVAHRAVATAQSSALHSARTLEWPITLAQWSLHRTIFNGDLDPCEFPAAARRFGIDGVEYVNQFYQSRSATSDWITALNRCATNEGVKNHLIMCDGEGDLGDPSSTARAAAVARHERWLEAAAALNCHSIRVNARSSGTPAEQHGYLVDGLAQLCERAGTYKLNVLVENHGAQSSDGVWLAALLRAVRQPEIGALPDFGNFRKSATDWANRYEGVRALIPLAKALSAKSHDFDREGNETSIDFQLMLDIARQGGYRGAIGIEYEGRRLSEDQGIRATKALLERLMARVPNADGQTAPAGR